jgi:hypothetical protein
MTKISEANRERIPNVVTSVLLAVYETAPEDVIEVNIQE